MQLKDTSKKNRGSEFNKFAKCVRKVANCLCEIKIRENLFKRNTYEHIYEIHMKYIWYACIWQNSEDLNYKKIIEKFL